MPKAHQVDREFKILKALDGHVPVPKVLLYDERLVSFSTFDREDFSLLDTPFYIMEYTKGRLFLDPSLKGLSGKDRQEIYKEALRVLVKIHTTDYRRVGLGDYGRSGRLLVCLF